MPDSTTYDCALVGGGIGGLTMAIHLAKAGYRVILFEKEQYPFHKVCGEYISMESRNYLEELGVSLQALGAPIINKLMVTAPDGFSLQQELPLGGFGISRYTIDNTLKEIALQNRVSIFESCKVENVVFKDDRFTIQTTRGSFISRTCCGSFGKRSNLDIKWQRPFAHHPTGKLTNYIGVKYHIKTSFPDNLIALHNFKDGYCGISKIEDDKYCLCYLTTASNLKASNNSIPEMEKNILCANPHLKKIFEHCTILYDSPLSIAHISFQKKTQVEHHMLLIGDAAGLITPLCGNGMSMAMHAGKIAAQHIIAFLQQRTTRAEMEKNYAAQWERIFARRLKTGRTIQYFFGKSWQTNIFIRIMKWFPGLTNSLIKKTHGQTF